jgi:hypothetical protein
MTLSAWGWDMSEDRLKTVTKIIAEGTIAGAVAILALVAIFIGTRTIFPEVNFLGLWSNGDEKSETTSKEEPPVAHLTQAKKSVRSRRADEIVWADASEGDPLFERSSVQTLRNASALIQFNDQNEMSVTQNSLVVIKGINIEKKSRKSFVDVVNGSFRSKVGGVAGEESSMEVSTPSATVVVDSSGLEPSDFRVDVNPGDKSANVMVYKGVAKVTAQGVTVEVGENQGTHIAHEGQPEAARPLMQPVVLDVPEDGNRSLYDDTTPPVTTLAWAPQTGAAAYRLQVASDPDFSEPLVDRTLNDFNFSDRSMQHGTYYWRVVALDPSAIEGAWSEARTIDVIQPALRITFPDQDDQTINQETLVVTGEAEPDGKTYLNGEPIALDEAGQFAREIPLHVGENLIVLESISATGDSRFQKRMVHRKS